MLDVLNQQLARYPQLEITTRIGDMRQPQGHHEFGLVVVAFNALQHLSTPQEVQQMFRSTRQATSQGGLLGIDVYLPRDDLHVLHGEQDELVHLGDPQEPVWRSVQTTLVEDGGRKMIKDIGDIGSCIPTYFICAFFGF